MRKVLLILVMCLVAFSVNAEDIYEQKAAQIYDMCDKKIPLVDENGTLSGNIADVNRERQVRQCLKREAAKIAATFIRKSELENFSISLNKLEDNTFAIYKTVLFCTKNDDEIWCRQRYNDDTSLDKLILEKSITSHILKVLEDLIEMKQDSLKE